jgi:hypothetical protein
MKYMVLAAAALMASTGLAGAADLARRAPVPVVEAVPASPFDAFISFGLGYQSGEIGAFDQSGFSGTVRGSFAANFAGPFGAQVDAELTRASNDSDLIGDNDTTTGTLAGHLYMRDQRVGALGVFGQYEAERMDYTQTISYRRHHRWYTASFDANGDTTTALGGVEGQYYFGPFTAYAQLAYQSVDSDFLGEGDGFAVSGQLRYFATPDWKFALKGTYDTVSFDHVDKDSWSVGLRTDYNVGKVASLPLNLFAEVSYGESTYDFGRGGSADENDARVMVGVTLNFDNKSLLERDRNGASFDTIKTGGTF